MYLKNFQIIDRNMFLSNQMVGFFDHQYVWNKTMF